MSAPPATAEVTTAVIAMLAANVAHPIGDGRAPSGAVEADGYVVVEVIDGGQPALSDLGSPGSPATTVIQVTAVGQTRLQAQAIADACRGALLARSAGTGAFVHPIDAFAYPGGITKSLEADAGVVVWRRDVDMDGGILMEGPTFNAPVRYTLGLQPA